MLTIKPISPAIGAIVGGVEFDDPLTADVVDQLYAALIAHSVIFIRGCDISPAAHLAFARRFGQLDSRHPHYPHVPGFDNIVLLENDVARPPDTNSWHTDLTFKAEQPFASILLARDVPQSGGDTLWSSNYAAYDRLDPGLQRYLATLDAIHDMGDFRNSFASATNDVSAPARLNDSVARFGHCIRPLVAQHPVSARKFLNFNEAFVNHIVGLTSSESNALKALLAHHMNKPEDQMRWQWQPGDLAMWDNRVTMHYAVADYLPHYRCMHRITVVADARANRSPAVL